MCEVADCPRIHYAQGLCQAHHRAEFASPPPPPAWTSCAHPRCTLPAPLHAVPLCRSHKRAAIGYSLPRARYVELLSGPCAACGTAQAVHIDHDHECCDRSSRSCGQCVRGGLCAGCNLAAGWVSGRNVERVLTVLRWLATEPRALR